MRKLSFIVVVFGMLVLSWFFIFGYVKVESYSDLEKLEINQKVFLSGKVVEMRVISNGRRILELDIENSGNSQALVSNETSDSRIELICECFEDYSGRKVFVEGIVSEFEKRKQVEVLEIAG
jgi:DNA/RNA endonuclease YhcR with UshA esterase domain